MSVSGLSSSDPLQTTVAQGAQNKFQQIQNQFQKVGQDLLAGNLTAAQSDFATLTQQLPSSQATTSSTSAGPTSTLAKAFQTLAQDLNAGNLSAAQADFATIQQNAQQPGSSQAQGHHHRHHGGGAGQTANTTATATTAAQQDFAALGQALQAGNLSTAQQAYATFQTDLQQGLLTAGAASGSGTTPVSSTSPTGSGAVDVTA